MNEWPRFQTATQTVSPSSLPPTISCKANPNAPREEGDDWERAEFESAMLHACNAIDGAKELVEKLGGMIWCESVLGLGCCFSFRLPAYQEPKLGPGSG